MEKKKDGKNKKPSFSMIAMFILYVLANGFIGFFMGKYWLADLEGSLGQMLLSMIPLLFLTVLVYYLQIILHEGGHLIFGLLSGYRFSSFRIGSIMLLKTSTGWSIKNMSLAGTAGQCLMVPPDYRDGSYPFTLYNLGGVLMNMISAAFFTVLYFVFGEEGKAAGFSFISALVGVLFTLMNGIPFSAPELANDGYNLKVIKKDPLAAKALWAQLKIDMLGKENVRIKDMPEEWFILPEDADYHNQMISAIKVFEENRHMDALEFEKVLEDIDFLFSENCAVNGVYKAMLTCDKVTIDILKNGEQADLLPLSEKTVSSILRRMKNYPAVLRTRYAEEKQQGNEKAAEKILRTFEKVAKLHPSPSEIESERELLREIDKKFAGLS